MTEEKISYKCVACGYKFKRNASSTSTKICPYCGKQDIVKNQKNEASKILEEANSRQYDF